MDCVGYEHRETIPGVATTPLSLVRKIDLVYRAQGQGISI